MARPPPSRKASRRAKPSSGPTVYPKTLPPRTTGPKESDEGTPHPVIRRSGAGWRVSSEKALPGLVDRRLGDGAVLLVALLTLREVVLRLVVELLLLVLAGLLLLLRLVLLSVLLLLLLGLVLGALLGVAQLLALVVLRIALETPGWRLVDDLLHPVEVLLGLRGVAGVLGRLAELL